MSSPLMATTGLAGLEPAAGTELTAQVVAATVWAPSVNNTQPWRFGVYRHGIDVYADPGRQLAIADPHGREMLISCGAALFTARLAVRGVGYIPEADVLPDPAEPMLIARVSWAHEVAPTEYERWLLRQVRRRRTHRGGFDPLPLSAEFLAVLQDCAERYGAQLRVVTDEGCRAALAAVVGTAERALELDSAYLRELAAWTPPPGSRRPDGVPVAAYPAHPERTVPHFPGRSFARGHGWGTPGIRRAARSAGVVCLLTTQADRPMDWINAGQALQRILLTSAASGVAVALHSQPFELDWGRELVRSRLRDPACPQLLLRLGTVIQTTDGVRRPPASVVFRGGSKPPRSG
jgi:nitroreductase